MGFYSTHNIIEIPIFKEIFPGKENEYQNSVPIIKEIIMIKNRK